MFCVECGKKLPAKGKFCPYCGTPVQPLEEEAPEEEKELVALDASAFDADERLEDEDDEEEYGYDDEDDEDEDDDDDDYDEDEDDDEWEGETLPARAGGALTVREPAIRETDGAFIVNLGGNFVSFDKRMVIFKQLEDKFKAVEAEDLETVKGLYTRAGNAENLIVEASSLQSLVNLYQNLLSICRDYCIQQGKYSINWTDPLVSLWYKESGAESVYDMWRRWAAWLKSKCDAVYNISEECREQQKEIKAYDDYVRDVTETGISHFVDSWAAEHKNSKELKKIDAAEADALRRIYEEGDLPGHLQSLYLLGRDTLLKNTAALCGLIWVTPEEKRRADRILDNFKRNAIPSVHLESAALEALTSDPTEIMAYMPALMAGFNRDGGLLALARLFSLEDSFEDVAETVFQKILDTDSDRTRGTMLSAAWPAMRGGDTGTVFATYIAFNSFGRLQADIAWMTERHEEIRANGTARALETLHAVAESYLENRKHCEEPFGQIIGFAQYMEDTRETIEIPACTEEIGAYAFANCPRLKTVILPGTVKSIAAHAFWNCPCIEELRVPAGVTYDLSAYTGPGTVILPEGVDPRADAGVIEEIKNGETTFDVYERGALGSFFVQNNLLAATSILTADVTQEILRQSGEWKWTSEQDARYVGLGARLRYTGTPNKELPAVITLPERWGRKRARRLGVSSFVESPFVYLHLPKNIQVIGETACYHSKLIGVWAEEGLKEIEPRAFAECGGLRELYLPNSLEKVGDGAFQNCASLLSVSLYAMRCEIGRDVFAGTTVVVECMPGSDWERYCKENGVRYYLHGGENPYAAELSQREYDAAGRRHTAIRQKSTAYGRDRLVSEWTNSAKISDASGIPKGSLFGKKPTAQDRTYFSVTQAIQNGDADVNAISAAIQQSAEKPVYISADGARNITIYPWAMKKMVMSYDLIATGTYAGVDPLFVDGRDKIEIVDERAFSGSYLLAVRLAAVKEIWNQAFAGCPNLQLVLLGGALRKIEDYAFANCPSLRAIYIPPSVLEIGRGAFLNDQLTVTCVQNSCAHQYCAENGIPVYLVNQ